MNQFGAPNFLAAIDAYEAGSRRAERNRLAELDRLGNELQGKALSGDQNALAQLGQVNPQAYMQTKQFTQQEKVQRLDELAAGAYAADTPEKWQAFVQKAAAQGHKLDPGETRESILDQAMGWKEKLAQSNVDRQFNQNKSNADRGYNLDVQQFNETKRYHEAQLSAEDAKLKAAAPDLVDLYDEQGRTYKGRWNPQTQTFDRVGGVKQSTDTPSGYRYAPGGKLEAIPGGPADPNRPGGGTTADFKDITAIRKEIGDLPSYKTYSAALPVYNSMVKAGATKAGDLNLVYGLAKIFDPGSVVREGEQVLVRDTASIPDWLVGQIESLNGGARLTESTRKAIMGEARNRMDAYKGAFDQNVEPYRGIAGRYQINEDDIIPQMGAIEEAPANGAADPLGIR